VTALEIDIVHASGPDGVNEVDLDDRRA